MTTYGGHTLDAIEAAARAHRGKPGRKTRGAR